MWTTAAPSLLAEENLKLVRSALDEGWVCGIHLHYCAGCGGDAVAFSDYAVYHEYVRQARPGDLFLLWSVGDLRKKNMLLVDSRYDAAQPGTGSLLSPDDLRRVEDYLAGSATNGVACEILAAGSFGTGLLEARWTDFDGSEWEPFLSLAQRASIPGGALCVLPLTTIDVPGQYLLEAKRPNEKGEVPLGGAY